MRIPSCTPPGLREQLGDYGYFENSDDFHCEGNIFDDINSRSSDTNISPNQHMIGDKQGYRDSDSVKAGQDLLSGGIVLHKPTGLSLPSSDHVNSILVLLSARFTDRYLVTRIIQCDQFTEYRAGPSGEPTRTEVFHIMYLIVEVGLKKMVSNATTPLCTFAKPLIWHRDENASSISGS